MAATQHIDSASGAVSNTKGANGAMNVNVVSSRAEAASDGTLIYPDNLDHTYGYTGINLTSDTVVVGGNTYVKTFTYSGTQLVSETKWVKQ